MTKVFIVTSGSYSDYEINAVFSTRELAQKYIDKIEVEKYGPFYGIEEYDLDTGIRNYDKSLYEVYACYQEKKHSWQDERREHALWLEDATEVVPISVTEEKNEYYNTRKFKGVVHAKDKAHALKILGEFTFSYNTQNPLPWLK